MRHRSDPRSLRVDEMRRRSLATGGPTARSSPGCRSASSTTRCRRRRSWRTRHPDDVELAVAGLVHDIGHLLPGGTDEAHADDGAAAVRGALGERVAGIVGLHVEAKRYLVATEGDYDGALTSDSVVSLRRQGGALTRGRRRRHFLARPGRPTP